MIEETPTETRLANVVRGHLRDAGVKDLDFETQALVGSLLAAGLIRVAPESPDPLPVVHIWRDAGNPHWDVQSELRHTGFSGLQAAYAAVTDHVRRLGGVALVYYRDDDSLTKRAERQQD